MYEISNADESRVCRAKLALSGIDLVVRSGGGFCSFYEYLHRKGFLNEGSGNNRDLHQQNKSYTDHF